MKERITPDTKDLPSKYVEISEYIAKIKLINLHADHFFKYVVNMKLQCSYTEANICFICFICFLFISSSSEQLYSKHLPFAFGLRFL